VKLPNCENATLPQEKITGYLLSASHRDGRHKAAFFTAFGFTLENWQQLATALLHHATEHEVVREENSPFGKRYVIEGIMRAADGRAPMLRSVWFIESGADSPRFVTAYPLRREDND
jgi:hypothetical protein